MNIQTKLMQLKKMAAANKKVYISYTNFTEIHGKITDIGNLFVHIKTDNQTDPIMLEIEKIEDISLYSKS